MNFKKYLKDKSYAFIILIISYFIILLMLFAFEIRVELIISITIIFLVSSILILTISYLRKKNFYNNLFFGIKNLDESYLVVETLSKPEFYEGKLLMNALYDINKSMIENVNNQKTLLRDFKNYIEMWIHEVKIPLATLNLTLTNKKGLNTKVKTQLKRVEDCVDQVLFYVRSENAEKDYLIKETNLKEIIKNVGLKNIDDLRENKIDFITENIDYKVLTDSKWLEFILRQIINNSIKYKRNIKNSYIKIKAFKDFDTLVLMIEDNGIGILKQDINQVFDKTFTGSNGREYNSSTGMGLFIAKNLCNKLGHKIKIESIKDKYTRVYITFGSNNYYDVLK